MSKDSASTTLTFRFKYSLISDLHLDHPQPKTPYSDLEENIIVAGDTMNGLSGLKFLQKLRNKEHNVYAVDGNHEHYCNVSSGRTIADTTARFQEEYPPRIDIDDTLSILLVNGWYTVTYPFFWYNYMNDCRYSVGKDALIGMHSVNMQAFLDAEFLSRNLEEDRDFIVVTHTSPCVDTLDPRYEGQESNQFYWSPHLREVLAKFGSKIKRWHHGHTHRYNSAIVDGVEVVCNPRGYPRENPDWRPLSLCI